MDPGSIRWERVRRLTVVPFLPDGRCALVPVAGGLALPSGEVLAGEDPVLDTGLRVPLVIAGFRRQGLHPFAVSGGHAVVWSEGDDGYRGARPHAEVELWKGPAAEAARRLRAAGDERAAALVEAADQARRGLDEAGWYRDGQWLMETSYLRAGTPRGGSGFGGTAAACPGGRTGSGSATLLGWTAPGGRRFDYVHTLLDLVPEPRLGQLVRHQLDHLVAPGGRLLVSSYVPVGDRSRHAGRVLGRLGFAVDGRTDPGQAVGRGHPPSAWIDRR